MIPQTLDMDTLVAMGGGANVAEFVTPASAALLRETDHDELRFLLVRRLAEAGLLRRAWVSRHHQCPPIWYGWEHEEDDVETIRSVVL